MCLSRWCAALCGVRCGAVSALAVYSLLFMRWAIAISPANYPLLVCHIANEGVQLTQLGRYAMASHRTHTHRAPSTLDCARVVRCCSQCALACDVLFTSCSDKKPSAAKQPQNVPLD